ncbi:MAG: hypothetical protein EP330_21720 [Deltaproteobacteria bacterium]|nr:MAG: hypothetical protein EP330_21720 [Deltaproteobacteria bacterium]
MSRMLWLAALPLLATPLLAPCPGAPLALPSDAAPVVLWMPSGLCVEGTLLAAAADPASTESDARACDRLASR